MVNGFCGNFIVTMSECESLNFVTGVAKKSIIEITYRKISTVNA